MTLGIIAIIIAVAALVINIAVVQEQRKTIVAQQKLIELQREANNMATRNARKALQLLARIKSDPEREEVKDHDKL